jgi:hypothetical protein
MKVYRTTGNDINICDFCTLDIDTCAPEKTDLDWDNDNVVECSGYSPCMKGFPGIIECEE